MLPGVVNIFRNKVIPLVVAASGIGTSFSQVFVKVYEVNGAPGVLQLGLTDVVGVFSALQVNVEWSPTNGAGTYYEVVGTWAPLTEGVGYFPISEAGYYRLNVTTFTGGTYFTVLATVGLPSGSGNSGASATDVTLAGSTITLPVSIAAPIAVTGTFWQAIQPVSGTVAVSNFPASQVVTGTFWQATQPVSGAFYPATQPVSNAALSELAFTPYGSPAVQALDVYIVNPTQAQEDTGAVNAGSGQISVLVTATQIVVARPTRNAVKITNTTGTYPVWIGFTSGVSATTGDLLPAVPGAFVIIPTQTVVYGISVGGTQVISFMDLYN
jgi:hypothetical protein